MPVVVQPTHAPPDSGMPCLHAVAQGGVDCSKAAAVPRDDFWLSCVLDNWQDGLADLSSFTCVWRLWGCGFCSDSVSESVVLQSGVRVCVQAS